ncbi:MAG: helix-turn-helix transcriptional regulator [Roseivivax sp.]|nr:helix-turn-helix transcriptional regulator [Roseivivax sp.]
MRLRERVGSNIQAIRRSKGISQEQLALVAEVDRRYMGKVENAENSVSLDVLEKIAKALDVDPSVLVAPPR